MRCCSRLIVDISCKSFLAHINYPISEYFACTNHMHVTVLSVVGDRSLSERILITATATVLYRQTQEILTDFVEEGEGWEGD